MLTRIIEGCMRNQLMTALVTLFVIGGGLWEIGRASCRERV